MKLKWKRRLKGLGAVAAAFIVILVILVQTGVMGEWVRRGVVAQIEKMSGGRVELKAFRFSLWGLRAELDDFVLHGREAEGLPPFFRAERLAVKLRVISVFQSKVMVDEVRIEKPELNLHFDKDGKSNAPVPKTEQPSGKNWHERIFDLTIRELRLNQGMMQINDVRVPLAVEGGEFQFALNFRAEAAGKEFYEGAVSWQKMKLAARRYLPFASDWRLKFTLGREGMEVSEFAWKLPHSELQAGARLASYSKPEWSFHYKGTLSLADLRTILRKPHSPTGLVDFSGEGNNAGGELNVKGNYGAREIELPYDWFHAQGISSRGSYRVAKGRLEVADLEAQALGGALTGRMSLEFDGVKFRVESRAQGISLASLLAAVNNKNFPVTTLHWSGIVSADSVTTWDHDFKHFASSGTTQWAPPSELRPGEIPVTAQIQFDYSLDQKAAVLRQSEIVTPTSRLELDGRLGDLDSNLAINLDARDLLPWDDFINRLRGENEEPRRIAGRATWKGRMLGALGGPTFAGHVRGFEAQYEKLYWDEIEGDLNYSPEELKLDRMRVRRGRSAVDMNLRLELFDWSYLPKSQWTMQMSVKRTPTDDLQALFGWNYAARALLSGEFQGRGTRSDPEFAGPFQLEQIEGWGLHAERGKGDFALRQDEVRIAHAEIQQGTGRVKGDFLYRMETAGQPAAVEFELQGSAITLEKVERIQTARFPLGGQLSFDVRGHGPVTAPVSDGTLRLENFRVGDEVMGSFDARLHSDGRRAQAELQSAMAAGRLEGKLEMTLGGDYPLKGDLTVKDFDLDVFIKTALRLKDLTGHSVVDGRFLLSGLMKKPESISIEADISQLKFDYQHVKLENVGPLRLVYRGEEVRIEQAHIRGPDTDLTIAGFVKFTGTRPVSLKLLGSVNLQLLGGFLPELEARGAAVVNTSMEGTLSNPRITGGVHVQSASAHYGDFPAGLSNLSGELVFDASRLVFENMTAETGGGKVVLSGTLTYGEGLEAVRYDLALQATRVRVRYPEGMSWLTDGTLHLTGTRNAGVLSGRVLVERLLLAEGFDLATLMVVSREGVRGPQTTSPYLRNLQFDVEAASPATGGRLEWTGARVESEASLRLRGTWDHPIFLGHIHLLSGEMAFRGNRYRLTRGDINFANPFRIDPALNVEATTTIRQYEITLNFSGPASRPSLGYRSDPPLPASDIIALLALGRTGEESELRSPTRVQSPEMGASTLLSEAISSQVGGRIERLLGVSRFRVDPFLAGTGTEQNASARVTIEQQIAHDLTITYITNVTSTQQQVIQVEYNVNKGLSIIALRDQNGTFGLDIKFKKRFK